MSRNVSKATLSSRMRVSRRGGGNGVPPSMATVRERSEQRQRKVINPKFYDAPTPTRPEREVPLDGV